MWRKIANFLAVVTAGAGVFACSPACDTSDEGNAPARFEGGTAVNGIYTSSSAHGDLLRFPGGQRYDLFHHLGFEPALVQLYWSFAEAGVGWDAQKDGKSSLSPAAGNSALIQLKSDEFIRVKNDSCADYWLLVVASGDTRAMDAGSLVDAGSD